MKDIFEFNHIDKNVLEENVKTFKDFYKDYQKRFWCFKKSQKRFKLLDDESITITVFCLMIIGKIVGRITLNPIILGVVNSSGQFLLQTLEK